MRGRGEEGQTSLLIIGLFLIGVMLVVVVVDASSAYLRRQQLDAVADGAALAAAAGVQGERVYQGGLSERAEIDPAVARRYVGEYLDRIGAGRRYPGLRVRVRTTDDSVEVRVATPLDLPFLPPGWETDATVTGTAASFVQVVD